MKFGFMPSFEADFFQELEFAKRHFDFIEITLKPDLSIYSREFIHRLRYSPDNFEILGHMHWSLDFSHNHEDEKQKACRSAEIFKEIGVRKITAHPSHCNGKNPALIMKNNILALRDVSGFCRSLNLQLMLENKIRPPFNKAEDFVEMLNFIPGIYLTLDVGHAALAAHGEINNFLDIPGKKINHIHLHDIIERHDHLFFEDGYKMKEMIDKIRNAGFDETITLEMFEVIREDRAVQFPVEERNSKLLEQLKLLTGFTPNYNYTI